MKRLLSFLILGLFFCCVTISAQQKSDLEKRAEAEAEKGNVPGACSSYIRAFEDYARQGRMKQSVASGVKATALYYKENLYQEAFDLLRRIDQAILAAKQTGADKETQHYYTSKERMQMYMKMHRSESAADHLRAMTNHANACNDEAVKNDLLYNKAIYHYTFGQVAQGNAVFKEMATKLTASKEYDKVDAVYKQLIANGRRSNSASMVAESYSNYMAWKDSTTVIRHRDEIAALKKQIADNEAVISDQDSSLTTRWGIIIGLFVLVGVLAAALIVGGVVLMRFIMLTRKQKKTIKLANDNNALKAKFIGNISAQLEPSLQKLDQKVPEVQALLDFSKHIQTLSTIENSMDEEVEVEEIQVQQYCEGLLEQIRDEVKSGVVLKNNAPKMVAAFNKDYVTHVLLHLLNNATEYTAADGTIVLDYKKRGAHTHQFMVSNTGQVIPEEERENLFKPFLEIKDLTNGDGLGLPICKQIALKMKGDLTIDPEFTKGVRFILELHS